MDPLAHAPYHQPCRREIIIDIVNKSLISFDRSDCIINIEFPFGFIHFSTVSLSASISAALAQSILHTQGNRSNSIIS